MTDADTLLGRVALALARHRMSDTEGFLPPNEIVTAEDLAAAVRIIRLVEEGRT